MWMSLSALINLLSRPNQSASLQERVLATYSLAAPFTNGRLYKESLARAGDSGACRKHFLQSPGSIGSLIEYTIGYSILVELICVITLEML